MTAMQKRIVDRTFLVGDVLGGTCDSVFAHYVVTVEQWQYGWEVEVDGENVFERFDGRTNETDGLGEWACRIAVWVLSGEMSVEELKSEVILLLIKDPMGTIVIDTYGTRKPIETRADAE